jgi:hypothetical protein
MALRRRKRICPQLWSTESRTNPAAPYLGGQLWPFIQAVGIYRCPIDKTNTATFKARANKLATYVQNGAVCGFGNLQGGNKTWKISDFRSDAFMMWEPDDQNPQPGYGYNDGSSYPDPAVDGALGRRHGKMGGIVLAIDGHVEYVKYDTWKKEAQLPTKNRMFCNPGSANGR